MKQSNYLFKDARLSSYYFAKEILPSLFTIINTPSSIVDLGGGLGGWCKAFQEYGVLNTNCIDHPSINLNDLLINKNNFIPCNFEVDMPPLLKSDLAVCIEFAEHIKTKLSSKIVNYLTSCSNTILFSAAIPGQGGLGHINEQWPFFWVEAFQRESFHFLDVIRPLIIENDKIPYYLRQNIFLIVHEDVLSNFNKNHSYNFNTNEWSLVHRSILNKRHLKNRIKNILPRSLKGRLEVWRYVIDSKFNKKKNSI
ncbi:MAG: hypothetical protein JETCAE03_27090 [Ignavibacteriaceae bacterium]|nr:MAG: hypothetical protein JETCAE03_27090 [Ignavibacteriaceae bacterium]